MKKDIKTLKLKKTKISLLNLNKIKGGGISLASRRALCHTTASQLC
ncbi:hypothetical protein J8L88_02955 [Aquimarina sp. MMG015]|nr:MULTISPECIES: hypothetical protein [Aquimarina]MBQ4801797.1 hypothetical protein [Aquimarina sp. MMG015]